MTVPTFGYVPPHNDLMDRAYVWTRHHCTHIGIQDDGTVEAHLPVAEEIEGPLPKIWTIVSVEPLTVTPSILCHGCGMHGHITNGEWVPC